MTLFFSVTFKGCEHRHTSTVEYFKDVSDNYKPHIESMMNICKSGLIKKLKDWNRLPEEIVSSHFFYRNGDEEITFFEWSK